jgi:OOP family OmpA-OmpF porin
MEGKTRAAFGIGTAVLLACACVAAPANATNIDDIRNVDVQGQSAFLQALTHEYRDIVIFEADEMYDWPDADFFAQKGLAAARGEVVLPEELGRWDLPAHSVDELTEARSRLMRQLDSGARDAKPEVAARTQGAFDCWVEQQEENHQPDDIAACRDDFFAALAELEAPPPQQAAAPQPMAPGSFMILFDWNSAVLTPEGQDVIRQVLAEAGGRDLSSVSTIGHADRSGSEEYNLALSLKRADAVRQALIDGGVPAASITAAGRGEAEPAIPTADGVREQANRRVEILLP